MQEYDYIKIEDYNKKYKLKNVTDIKYRPMFDISTKLITIDNDVKFSGTIVITRGTKFLSTPPDTKFGFNVYGFNQSEYLCIENSNDPMLMWFIKEDGTNLYNQPFLLKLFSKKIILTKTGYPWGFR